MSLFDKLGGYASQMGQFSILAHLEYLFLYACPSIITALTGQGRNLFLAVVAASMFHHRIYHVSLPFIILYARIPDFKDYKFWGIIILYSWVQILWILIETVGIYLER